VTSNLQPSCEYYCIFARYHHIPRTSCIYCSDVTTSLWPPIKPRGTQQEAMARVQKSMNHDVPGNSRKCYTNDCRNSTELAVAQLVKLVFKSIRTQSHEVYLRWYSSSLSKYPRLRTFQRTRAIHHLHYPTSDCLLHFRHRGTDRCGVLPDPCHFRHVPRQLMLHGRTIDW
jgi:hypothetical protein